MAKELSSQWAGSGVKQMRALDSFWSPWTGSRRPWWVPNSMLLILYPTRTARESTFSFLLCARCEEELRWTSNSACFCTTTLHLILSTAILHEFCTFFRSWKSCLCVCFFFVVNCMPTNRCRDWYSWCTNLADFIIISVTVDVPLFESFLSESQRLKYPYFFCLKIDIFNCGFLQHLWTHELTNSCFN